MRSLVGISCATVMMIVTGQVFASTDIQMLPPVTEGAKVVCPKGSSRILTWDGATSVACASSVTASGGNVTANGTVAAGTLSATTQVTAPQVTINGVTTPLNVTTLTTLVNLLNTPTCATGEVLTKTGKTTFACIMPPSSLGTTAAAVSAGTTTMASNVATDDPNAAPPPPPPPALCGPASIQTSGVVSWSTCTSPQELCGAGSIPSNVTASYAYGTSPLSGGPVWAWTCTNTTSNENHICTAYGATPPGLTPGSGWPNYGTCGQ